MFTSQLLPAVVDTYCYTTSLSYVHCVSLTITIQRMKMLSALFNVRYPVLGSTYQLILKQKILIASMTNPDVCLLHYMAFRRIFCNFQKLLQGFVDVFEHKPRGLTHQAMDHSKK